MMATLSWACLTLPLIVLGQPSIPGFSIDLDLPARQRHRAVARAYKDVYPEFMSSWEAALSRRIPDEERKDWMKYNNINLEYLEEIHGFVDEVGHPDVTFERVVLLNLMYELNYPTFCTGVLATDATGRVYHGRNLDFVMPYKVGGQRRSISELMVNLTYTKSGTPAFGSVGIIGYIGLQTAIKLNGHYKWSFQQNSHLQNDRRWNLKAMQDGAKPFNFVLRDLIVQDLDFPFLMNAFETTRFSSPNHFLLAGQAAWQGAAMEVDRNNSDLLDNLDHIQVLAPQVGRVFLVQTNSRNWDEPEDDRRGAAAEMLTQMGGPWHMTEESVMRLMRSKPLFNEYTTLSMVSIPSTGYNRALTDKDTFEPLNLLAKNRRFKLVLR